MYDREGYVLVDSRGREVARVVHPVCIRLSRALRVVLRLLRLTATIATSLAWPICRCTLTSRCRSTPRGRLRPLPIELDVLVGLCFKPVEVGGDVATLQVEVDGVRDGANDRERDGEKRRNVQRPYATDVVPSDDQKQHILSCDMGHVMCTSQETWYSPV